MSKSVRDLLNFFKQIITLQKSIYECKLQLVKLRGFDVTQLFYKISKGDQCINIPRVQEYIKLKIACNERELYEVFQKFDHTRCGYIVLSDFANQLVPISQKKKKESKRQPSYEIQVTFLRLLSVIIRGSSVLDVWRQELHQTKPFILFQLLNKSLTGLISQRELVQFFLSYGEQLNHIDAQILLRSLLRRHYKELNLQVFCENLNPLQFGYYEAFRYNFEQYNEFQIKNKAALAKQAIELQQNYLKGKRNKQIVESIHKQAALSREQELQLKVKGEIRAYQQLKFATMKKYHPHISFQYFLIMEKQNERRTLQLIQEKSEEARMREEIYKNKIKNVEALMEVQQFQKLKNIQSFNYDRIPPSNQGFQVRRSQLQKQIKTHAFSRVNTESYMMKRKVQNDLSVHRKML